MLLFESNLIWDFTFRKLWQKFAGEGFPRGGGLQQHNKAGVWEAVYELRGGGK